MTPTVVTVFRFYLKAGNHHKSWLILFDRRNLPRFLIIFSESRSPRQIPNFVYDTWTKFRIRVAKSTHRIEKYSDYTLFRVCWTYKKLPISFENLLIKTIFLKVDLTSFYKPQICWILPYFFQLLDRAEFCKFEVYLIFHINLKKNGV